MKSSEKPNSSLMDKGFKHVNSIEVWKTQDGGEPLPAEAGKMLNKSLFEVWITLQEAFDLAVLIGADVEQYRDEIRQLVEMIEPTDA